MSLDDLRADIKRATKDANLLDGATGTHLQNTLWPFLDGLLDHLGEMGEDIGEIDEAVAELVDHEEDYLQPDTAAVFAGIIQAGRALAAELQSILTNPGFTPRTEDDERIKLLIEHCEQMCQQGMAILGEITMVRPDEAPADPKDAANE